MEEKEKKQLIEAIENIKSKRYAETIGMIEPLAEKGNAVALFWLGYRYLHLIRVPNNDPELKRRFIFIKPDEKKAIEYISLSAEKGYPLALDWLARAHQRGLILQKDDIKAFSLWQKAADKGYIPSIYSLSECYRKALGTTKNRSEAFRLCKQAAEAEYSPAELRLAEYYTYGFALDPSQTETVEEKKERHEKALFWYKKSAEHGNMLAQYELGRYYLEKENDKEQARYWLQQAAQRRLRPAIKLLEEIV